MVKSSLLAFYNVHLYYNMPNNKRIKACLWGLIDVTISCKLENCKERGTYICSSLLYVTALKSIRNVIIMKFMIRENKTSMYLTCSYTSKQISVYVWETKKDMPNLLIVGAKNSFIQAMTFNTQSIKPFIEKSIWHGILVIIMWKQEIIPLRLCLLYMLISTSYLFLYFD